MRRGEYGFAVFRQDFVAAATVAIVALPQSIAYALIAGVDPIYGLYTTIVGSIVGSLFGSSSHLITGSTNATALMVAGVMKQYLGTDALYPTLFVLTFMVGIVKLGFGLMRAGKIVNYVSPSVILGFTAGAGAIIGLGQLGDLLGVRISSGYHPLYEKVWLTLAGAGPVNPWAVALSAGTVVTVLLLRRLSRAIPGPLVALLLASVLAAALDLEGRGVALVGAMPASLPPFHVPAFSFGVMRELAPGAVAVAVVGLVEALAIAKSIALSSGQRIDASREFMGQGLASLTGSFLGCFPPSGSFTRSAVNYSSQGRTRVAGILSGLLVAATVLFLAGYARYIPRASLAGVIVLVAYSMVDQHAIRKIAKASRHDLTVLLVTMAATVAMPDLQKAILTGIVVSVFVHLWNTGEIRVRLLRRTGERGFREMDIEQGLRAGSPGDAPIIHIEGDLYFGSAGDLRDKLQEVADLSGAPLFVLRLKRVRVMDISAFDVLETFIERCLAAGKGIVLCGISPDMKRFLDKVGITSMVGAENVFLAGEQIYESASKAHDRAQAILSARVAARHSSGAPQ